MGDRARGRGDWDGVGVDKCRRCQIIISQTASHSLTDVTGITMDVFEVGHGRISPGSPCAGYPRG